MGHRGGTFVYLRERPRHTNVRKPAQAVDYHGGAEGGGEDEPGESKESALDGPEDLSSAQPDYESGEERIALSPEGVWGVDG